MKVGDLVRPINPKSINHDKLIEVIEIEEGFLKRILLKFHTRTTIGGGLLHSWEIEKDWEVDIQRMRDKKLSELGL